MLESGIDQLQLDDSSEEENENESEKQLHPEMSQHTTERNRVLLERMLELESPMITTKMIDFLQQDDVCRLYMNMITQVPESGQDLDGPLPVGSIPPTEHVTRESERVTKALRQSYKATMLITSEDVTESLACFLKSKCALMTNLVFRIFQPNARGTLAHGSRVLDKLLRYHLDDVYDVLNVNAAVVGRYLGNMLSEIADPCVAQVFVSLVSKPHDVASVRFYISSPAIKWRMYKTLAEWKVLAKLLEPVTTTTLKNEESSSPHQFSSSHLVAIADVFHELLDRLAADDNGELLLQPLVHCPEILEGLVHASISSFVPSSSESESSGADESSTLEQEQLHQSRKTSASRILEALLSKCRPDRVPGPATSPYESSYGSSASANPHLVENQLLSLRGRIFALMETHVPAILKSFYRQYQSQQAVRCDDDVLYHLDQNHRTRPIPPGAIRHTAYVTKVPFGECRVTLLKSLVYLVTAKPTLISEHFTVDCWRALIRWFFEYQHNNMYHASFSQLLFFTLRSGGGSSLEENNTPMLQLVFQKLKLMTLFLDHYHNQPNSSAKGHILSCCNTIRLYLQTLPPTSFLSTFLSNHQMWRNFQHELVHMTKWLCVPGLGLSVPLMPPRYTQGDPRAPWPPAQPQRLTAQDLDSVPDATVNLGSEFAKSLGFVHDRAWCEDTPQSQLKEDDVLSSMSSTSTGGGGSSKKKNRKSKKKKASSVSSDDTSSSVSSSSDLEEEKEEENSSDALNHEAPRSSAKKKKKKNKKKKKH